MPDANERSSRQKIQVGGITISRAELDAGVMGVALLRASAKKQNAPLDANDVKALLANAVADGKISPQEMRDLFLVYVLYADRMTAQGRDAL